MKISIVLLTLITLTGCAFSDQARIENHKSRCELIGFKKDTSDFTNCVFELEKQASAKAPVISSNTSSTQQSISSQKDACLYNPANQRNETCYHVTAGGSCAHFGAPCIP